MTGCKYYCKLVSGFSNTNCKLFLGRDIIKVWFSALRFVIKIATFAKPGNDIYEFSKQIFG